MPKISVCMATRNGEKYIHQQMESIIKQLEQDDEIVISDDSSTDNTVNIIKSFHDKRIRLFENNTFYSPIFNIENALKKATGDIIVLADQDDIWLDNKISVIRKKFMGKTVAIFLIMLDGYIIDKNEAIISDSIFGKIKAGKGIMKNIYDNTYMGCNLAFSRELLKIALPFPRKIPMHDVWLGLLSELFGKVEFVDEKTIKYRLHQLNVSFRSRNMLEQIKRRFFLAFNLFKRFSKIKSYGICFICSIYMLMWFIIRKYDLTNFSS